MPNEKATENNAARILASMSKKKKRRSNRTLADRVKTIEKERKDCMQKLKKLKKVKAQKSRAPVPKTTQKLMTDIKRYKRQVREIVSGIKLTNCTKGDKSKIDSVLKRVKNDSRVVSQRDVALVRAISRKYSNAKPSPSGAGRPRSSGPAQKNRRDSKKRNSVKILTSEQRKINRDAAAREARESADRAIEARRGKKSLFEKIAHAVEQKHVK